MKNAKGCMRVSEASDVDAGDAAVGDTAAVGEIDAVGEEHGPVVSTAISDS
jgi:hypothetical protein